MGFNRLSLAMAVVLQASAAGVAPAASPATASVGNAIQPQSLGSALTTFAHDSGLQIIYLSRVADGVRTRGAPANLGPKATLQKLLEGTGLRFRFSTPTTVTIFNPVDSQGSTESAVRTHTNSLSAGAEVRPPAPARRENPSIAPAPSRNSTESSTLEEIIVTAQKRKEVLRDIPQSITVVDSATLQRQQAHNFQDYIGLIPGLSLQGDTPGADHITLRGINSGSGSATVAVYLDDVPFGSSSGLANGTVLAGDFDTLDMERLEVLRGPQGTLYGATSLGGVLKFVTRAPQTDAFAANAQTSLENVSGGGTGYSGSGMVNIPFADRFAVRATGFYRRVGGFVDSTGLPIFDLGHPTTVISRASTRDNTNDAKVYGGRISGLLNATDKLSVRLSVLLQNIHSAANSLVEADPTTLEPLNGGLTFSQFHPDTTDTKYRVYSATVNWDLGFGNLVSSSSYATLDARTVLDLALGADQALTAAFGRPLSAVQNANVGTNKITEELRLSSPSSDTFEWLIGAFFTRENSLIAQNQVTVEAGTETLATDIQALSTAHLSSSYQEYAVFSNDTWHVAPRFDLTLGGRLSRNKQNADLLETGLLVGPAVAFNDLHSEENVFTYSVAPRFKLSDTASLYARVASGYRPGGPNVIPPNVPPGTPLTFRADRTTNYEAGLKADWFDRAVSLDVAAYYTKWQDIQLFAVINQVGLNENGGTATSKGVEFTVATRPVRALTLTLNGAYSDAYLTEDTPVVTGGFKGDPLPFVPRWGLNLSGDYEWTVLQDLKANIGSSVRYVGRQTSDFLYRTPTGSLYRLPTYEVVDLRAGVRRGRWSVEAFARNVGNKRGVTSLFQNVAPNGELATGVLRPRTIGLTLGVEF